jgi:hypothetical protein
MSGRSGFAVLALVLAGCFATAHPFESTTVPLNGSPRPLVARGPASVEVFVATRPERALVEVALVQTLPTSAYGAESGELLVALRDQAARVGCDAVFGLHSVLVRDGLSVRVGMRGICAVYRDANAISNANAER